MAKHAYSDRDDPERSSRHVTLLSWHCAFLRPVDGIILQTPSTGVDLQNMFLVPRSSERVRQDVRGDDATEISEVLSRNFWKQYTAATSNVIAVEDQPKILLAALESSMLHRLDFWDGVREKNGDRTMSPPVNVLIDNMVGRKQWSSPEFAMPRYLVDTSAKRLDKLCSLRLAGHWYLGSIHGKNVRVSITLQDWAAIATIVACMGQYESLKGAAESFVSDVRWIVESVYTYAPFESKTIEYDGSSEENSLEQLQLFFDRRRMRIDDNQGLTPSEKSMNLLLENCILDTDIKWDNG